MSTPDPATLTGNYESESDTEPTSPASAEFPERIGRYLVQSILGAGGFGVVFLARDEQLQRPVAIKVPHRKLVPRPEDAELYLTEARTVANLDHPNIVPVHDVGSSADYPCYFVSKYIEGSNLAHCLKNRRYAIQECAELAAAVADALHYAHRQGLVHRDIKPGNILIDTTGKPYLADFGLALREENIGQGPKYTGTPGYMSPEQSRGEGHRVDGRSDIFSLGVVMYEMLVGQKPFRADSRQELMDQISTHEPRPPRQSNDRVPKELERICLKAMAKRASERYTTAKDLVDDLRQFLADLTVGRPSATDTRNGAATPTTAAATPGATLPISTAGSSASHVSAYSTGGPPLRIVPKGLRSFDAHDADFFLELLPGPRDRDGLPDSIRFWKTRIEQTDSDETFAVGLIYGPSGCGKSSLVKAGLLPHLSADVIVIYLEATAEETEARLLSGLQKRFPEAPTQDGITTMLTALRRGQGLLAGKKVLIILDQFEQWLHANREEANTELVQALRQCDGGRVQCIVMVRDDFWMAATRFMRDLEIHLVEGQNSAAVDLFPIRHAEKVLTAYGRAFGALPSLTPGLNQESSAGDISKDQRRFLQQAVAGLAQEGKVICVRLALFADMMKDKPWTPASLQAVGGAAGVGATFLEETFSAATAPPEHRLHQQAARAVLKALLPEAGADIKGHMRSHAELLEASGYAARPKEFDDLIRILDSEVRLITPTDSEAATRSYQLTHDYLVHSLRDWLTRKQKETRRGRAELFLADRAAIWHARPENRQLPSFFRWIGILCLTRRQQWTDLERRMMRRASRYYGTGALALLAVLALLGVFAWEGSGRMQARTVHDRLLIANTADVPGIVNEMTACRRWLDPLLRESNRQAEAEGDTRKQLHTALALLPVDRTQVECLRNRLLQAEPDEIIVLRDALNDHRHDWIENLWSILENRTGDLDQRFRAACALASYDPRSRRWDKVRDDVAAKLVAHHPLVLAKWTEALQPISKSLLPTLATMIEDERRGPPERGLIATVYAAYCRDPATAYPLALRLAGLLQVAPTGDALLAYEKKVANYAAALLVMNQGDEVWSLLAHKPDPTLRSLLIDRIAPTGVEPRVLLAQLDKETNVSVQRALLLSLGGYGLDHLPQAERHNLLPRFVKLFRDHPDPGMHAAAESLLRQWQPGDDILNAVKDLATGKFEGQRHWYVNRQGQTMVLVNAPGTISMGEGEEKHQRRIERRFAIASKQVTVEQFLRFHKDQKVFEKYAPTPDCPVHAVSWYDAAAYCNWLSQQEGIPPEQWCYFPNADGAFADGMRLAPNYLTRIGYRLPTEAEWTLACQAGAATDFSWGRTAELVNRYAWNVGNSLGRSHPVGTLRPNDLGLFDMHGNLWEWTQSTYQKRRPATNAAPVLDIEEDSNVDDRGYRVLLGGSWGNQPADVRAAWRIWQFPTHNHFVVGFRPARTVPPNP